MIAERENGDGNTAFFSPFRYRIAPEIVAQRTLAAMERLGVGLYSAAGSARAGRRT